MPVPACANDKPTSLGLPGSFQARLPFKHGCALAANMHSNLHDCRRQHTRAVCEVRTSSKEGRFSGSEAMQRRARDSRPAGVQRWRGVRGRACFSVAAACAWLQLRSAHSRCPAAISHISTPNAYTSAACMHPSAHAFSCGFVCEHSFDGCSYHTASSPQIVACLWAQPEGMLAFKQAHSSAVLNTATTAELSPGTFIMSLRPNGGCQNNPSLCPAYPWGLKARLGMWGKERHLRHGAAEQHFRREVAEAGVLLLRRKAARVQLAQHAPVRHLRLEPVRCLLQPKHTTPLHTSAPLLCSAAALSGAFASYSIYQCSACHAGHAKNPSWTRHESA